MNRLRASSVSFVLAVLAAGCSAPSSAPSGNDAGPSSNGDAGALGVTLTKTPTLNMYAVSNVALPTFGFAVAGANVQSITCQLDTAAAVDCSSLTFSQSVTEGPHTFVVTATDQAGASQQSPPFKWTYVSPATQASAAQSTAVSAATCVAISPFYWEIGDQTTGGAPTVSGSIGVDPTTNAPIQRTTVYSIASASKWMFAAYTIQKLNGAMDPVTQKFLHLSSGYTTFQDDSCDQKYGTNTVTDCANMYCWIDTSTKQVAGCSLQAPVLTDPTAYTVQQNSTYTAGSDGFFSYGGGHFQRYAVAAGPGVVNPGDNDGTYGFNMGGDICTGCSPQTSPTLASDVLGVLGITLAPFSYSNPQLAGGVDTSAAEYATFLQNILNGTLKINAFLGADPVCTNPAKGCTTAKYTPIPEENLSYSYGHWVENDPTAMDSDGAFNSAGAFGFYPWIDASKTYYGVISREQSTSLTNPDSSIGNGYHSELCGRQIRKAFFTGVPEQ